MSEATFLEWLARELHKVLTTPIENDQRLKVSRELAEIFAQRAADLSPEQSGQILQVLNRWIITGQIDGYKVPADKETFSWIEGVVGTLADMLDQ